MSALRLVYSATRSHPVQVEPLSLKATAPYGFDWTDRVLGGDTIAELELVNHNPELVTLGDGVTSITRLGQLVTPPAATINGLETFVGIYVTAPNSDLVLFKNAVVTFGIVTTAGETDERSLRLMVAAR